MPSLFPIKKSLSTQIFFAIFSFTLSLSFNLHSQTTQKLTKPEGTPKEVKEKIVQESITVFAAGDIADCRNTSAENSMANKTANIIESSLNKDKQAIVLTLGDNTYPIGKPEEFSDCYHKTWGRFKARTLPSPGNHDYGVPLALGYYNYFDELAGPDRRGYYTKTLGQWRIFSLNSNIKDEAMQKQMTWLKEELKQNKAACTLAFWHHPLFSSGGHPDNNKMQDIWNLLSEAKADIVLAGHDHNYERFLPLDKNGNPDELNGIHSFIVGTGGAKLTPMFFPKSITAIRNNNTHGVLKLTLYARSYDWEFIALNEKVFQDRGHGACH